VFRFELRHQLAVQATVNWYCSLLTRRTVCGRAAVNATRTQNKPSENEPRVQTQTWRYKTIVVIKLRWCLAVNWSHASIIPVNFRKPILYHVKAGFTCTVVILQPMWPGLKVSSLKLYTAARNMHPTVRAGVSKGGARFETLLQGPTQWRIGIFEGVNQGVMIEIGGVTKARPERVTPRPLQQRLQWTTPLKSINRRNTTLIKTFSLARHLPDQSYECSTCREERYWVLS